MPIYLAQKILPEKLDRKNYKVKIATIASLLGLKI